LFRCMKGKWGRASKREACYGVGVQSTSCSLLPQRRVQVARAANGATGVKLNSTAIAVCCHSRLQAGGHAAAAAAVTQSKLMWPHSLCDVYHSVSSCCAPQGQEGLTPPRRCAVTSRPSAASPRAASGHAATVMQCGRTLCEVSVPAAVAIGVLTNDE
jgi:hypothetical protein